MIYARWQYGDGQVGSLTTALQEAWANEWLSDEDAQSYLVGMIDELIPAAIGSGAYTFTMNMGGKGTTITIAAPDASESTMEAALTLPNGETLNLTMQPTGEGTFIQTIDYVGEGRFDLRVTEHAADGSVIAEAEKTLLAPYPLEYEAFAAEEKQEVLQTACERAGGIVAAAEEIRKADLSHLMVELNPAVLLAALTAILLLAEILLRYALPQKPRTPNQAT